MELIKCQRKLPTATDAEKGTMLSHDEYQDLVDGIELGYGKLDGYFKVKSGLLGTTFVK